MVRTPTLRWLLGEEADLVTDGEAQAIFAAHAILVSGTVLLSPLIADLAGVFRVSEAEAGLLIIVYTGTFLVVLPAAGVVADRIGRRATIVPGLVVFGVAGAAVGLADDFALALALRVVQATGVALAQPSLVALLGDLYGGARETTAQGVRVAVDSAFSVVTPAVAGGLFVLSWRYPFAVYLLAVPIALWLRIRLPPVDAGSDRPMGRYLHDLWRHVRELAIGLLLVSFFVRHLLLYGVYTYISVFAIRVVGVDVVTVGLLLSLLSAFKLLSASQAGRFVAALDPSPVVLVGFVLSGGGVLLLGAVPSYSTLVVGVMVHGFGDGLISPTQKSLVNRLSPPRHRSSAMALAFTFTNLGRSIGPLALGVLLGLLGPVSLFVLLGAVGGAAGVACLAGVWRLAGS